MNKCENEFCPECGQSLYKKEDVYFCVECAKRIPIDDIANFEQIRLLRNAYEFKARHQASLIKFKNANEAEKAVLLEEMKQIRRKSARQSDERRKTYPHTHYELRDPRLRLILANEIWLLRRKIKEGSSGDFRAIQDEWWRSQREGMDVILSRLEALQKTDIKILYVENYLTKFMKGKK